MKVYLAGTSVTNPKEEKRLPALFKCGHKLHSYYHCVNGFEKKWFKTNMANKVDLFLDSGAFSAVTQNEEINIKDYIKFIKKKKSRITVYSNLDVIGNPEATWKNQQIMEKQGLSPLPVFHYGTEKKWLEMYIAKGYKYISLGGMVPISTKDLKIWLDDLFANYLTDKKGMPIIKVHGFGLTSHPLMVRYPWYSVDSTSWVVTGRLGSIFIPKFIEGKYVYNTAPNKIAVSSMSPSLSEKAQHINTVSKHEKLQYLKYIKEKGFVLGKSKFYRKPASRELIKDERWVGKKPKGKDSMREVEVIIEPGICNQYSLRDEINVMYYLDLEKRLPKYPWAFKIKVAKKVDYGNTSTKLGRRGIPIEYLIGKK